MKLVLRSLDFHSTHKRKMSNEIKSVSLLENSCYSIDILTQKWIIFHTNADDQTAVLNKNNKMLRSQNAKIVFIFLIPS